MVCIAQFVCRYFPQIVALPTEREAFTMDAYDPRAKGTEKVFKTTQFQQLFSINQFDSREKLLSQATKGGFHLSCPKISSIARKQFSFFVIDFILFSHSCFSTVLTLAQKKLTKKKLTF